MKAKLWSFVAVVVLLVAAFCVLAQNERGFENVASDGKDASDSVGAQEAGFDVVASDNDLVPPGFDWKEFGQRLLKELKAIPEINNRMSDLVEAIAHKDWQKAAEIALPLTFEILKTVEKVLEDMGYLELGDTAFYLS